MNWWKQEPILSFLMTAGLISAFATYMVAESNLAKIIFGLLVFSFGYGVGYLVSSSRY
jgi:multisubunit Na+/H+ antiporter MnhC subunit